MNEKSFFQLAALTLLLTLGVVLGCTKNVSVSPTMPFVLTSTNTATLFITNTPTVTATNTITSPNTLTNTPTNTNTSTITNTPTNTPTATFTDTATLTPTATQVTLTYLFNTYINTPIGSSRQCNSCHSAGFPPDPTSANTFWNSTVSQTASFGCATIRVNPGDNTTSALYLRLAGLGCSPQMPNGGPTYLNASQLAEVAAWINEGALNN